jgi:hypothetical protein
MAAQWHGKVVTREVKDDIVYGRMVFQGPEGSKWYRIYWEDGTNSEHDGKILSRLGVAPENAAPPSLMHPPEPITILAAEVEPGINWSIRTVEDVRQRMESLLPGSGYQAATIFHSIPKRNRTAMVRVCPPEAILPLTTILDISQYNMILDPWAESNGVVSGLKNALLHINQHAPPAKIHKPTLVDNNRWGRASIQAEPLEPFLYNKILGTSSLSAVIMAPPLPLLDVALVTALRFVKHGVFMYVPKTWLSQAPASRMQLLDEHYKSDTLLIISAYADPISCWVCFFTSYACFLASLRPGVEPIDCHVLI